MKPPPLPNKVTESSDTSRPPGSLLFPTPNTYSDDNRDVGFCMGAEMGFPLTTLGASSHNILSSTTPFLIDSMIPNDEYPVDLISQLPVTLDLIPAESMTGSSPTPPILRKEAMEMDDGLGVFHLLMAYAEATEMGQEELAEVIAKRIGEKVSVVGEIVERLMYFMFQTLEKQSDYLKQEASKNFYPAFKAFYQMFPYGKFAHLAANSAILELLTNEIEILHIFDFDLGEGLQWASLIEALGRQPRQVVVTAIKLNDEVSPTMWKFQDTKKRLCDYATSYGIMFNVEELELRDLRQEELLPPGGGRGFFTFNCMVGLPHMGRQRNRKDVLEFLQAAQDFLQHAASGTKGGVIIFGDGDAWEKVRSASNYSSFLDGSMAHYQAMLESIYMNFPPSLGEARTCMECLFVAPFVSCATWARAWEDTRYSYVDDFRISLGGWRMSQDTVMEAKEMVKEGESLYGVRVEGDSSNEMVLDWRGIPLVRLSCWRS